MGQNENGDYQAPLTGGIQDDKAYRRFVASSSVDQTDNRAVWNNEMNDAFAALKQQESAGVRDREEKIPLGVRILSALLVLAACIGFLAALSGIGTETVNAALWITTMICIAGRIMISVWKYKRNQKAWIDRVNGQK